jgi:hypothetical protein
MTVADVDRLKGSSGTVDPRPVETPVVVVAHCIGLDDTPPGRR